MFKDEKRRREIEQDRMKECTFKPKTNENKNGNTIKRSGSVMNYN